MGLQLENKKQNTINIEVSIALLFASEGPPFALKDLFIWISILHHLLLVVFCSCCSKFAKCVASRLANLSGSLFGFSMWKFIGTLEAQPAGGRAFFYLIVSHANWRHCKYSVPFPKDQTLIFRWVLVRRSFLSWVGSLVFRVFHSQQVSVWVCLPTSLCVGVISSWYL